MIDKHGIASPATPPPKDKPPSVIRDSQVVILTVLRCSLLDVQCSAFSLSHPIPSHPTAGTFAFDFFDRGFQAGQTYDLIGFGN